MNSSLLAPDEFARLNEEFYSADPAYYFQRRMSLLALDAAAGEELEARLAQGVQLDRLRVQLDDRPQSHGPPTEAYSETGADGTWASPEGRRRLYFLIEAEMLLHHLAETTLRYYFGHVDRPACPWIEIANRTRGDFKRRLQDEAKLSSEALRERVRDVYYGGVIAADLRTDDRTLNEHLDAAAKLHTTLRRLCLRDACYNAAKHGLAVLGGGVIGQVHVGQIGDQAPILESKGLQLTYPRLLRDSKKDPWRWWEVSEWIDPEHYVAIVHLGTILLANLWDVAAHRYVGRGEPARRFVQPEDVVAIARSHHGDIDVMQRRLRMRDEAGDGEIRLSAWRW